LAEILGVRVIRLARMLVKENAIPLQRQYFNLVIRLSGRRSHRQLHGADFYAPIALDAHVLEHGRTDVLILVIVNDVAQAIRSGSCASLIFRRARVSLGQRAAFCLFAQHVIDLGLDPVAGRDRLLTLAQCNLLFVGPLRIVEIVVVPTIALRQFARLRGCRLRILEIADESA
jgi:hypothetical protein